MPDPNPAAQEIMSTTRREKSENRATLRGRKAIISFRIALDADRRFAAVRMLLSGAVQYIRRTGTRGLDRLKAPAAFQRRLTRESQIPARHGGPGRIVCTRALDISLPLPARRPKVSASPTRRRGTRALEVRRSLVLALIVAIVALTPIAAEVQRTPKIGLVSIGTDSPKLIQSRSSSRGTRLSRMAECRL